MYFGPEDAVTHHARKEYWAHLQMCAATREKNNTDFDDFRLLGQVTGFTLPSALEQAPVLQSVPTGISACWYSMCNMCSVLGHLLVLCHLIAPDFGL